jgi:hypothetical protein
MNGVCFAFCSHGIRWYVIVLTPIFASKYKRTSLGGEHAHRTTGFPSDFTFDIVEGSSLATQDLYEQVTACTSV